MPQEVLEYLRSRRICVVAVEMPDGSPHAATVHFALHENPIAFVIQTSPEYRKSEPLLAKESVRASLVVSLEEQLDGKDKTFQLDGVARVLKPEDDMYVQTYLDKFPRKDEKFTDDIFFIVTPTWWRFTAWNTPKGKVLLTSEA